MGLALLVLSRSRVLRHTEPASRVATRLCAGLVGGVSLVYQRVLVANPSDNAYLIMAVLGMALVVPTVLFLVAALVPSVLVRRWLGRIAVALVVLIGVLAVLPAPFILVSLVGALGTGDAAVLLRSPVTVTHLAMAGLGLLMLGLVWYWQRPARPRPATER